MRLVGDLLQVGSARVARVMPRCLTAGVLLVNDSMALRNLLAAHSIGLYALAMLKLMVL